MFSPSTLQSQAGSRPGRRPRRPEEGEELGKKPKKVNSEIRKQQNRIASRNYREKRKRKLQYLQQLIKDGSNDEQTPEPSPQQHEAHLRPLSADYEAGPSSSPFMLHANVDFQPVVTSSTAVGNHGLAANTTAFDANTLLTTPAYPPFESSWSSPVYDPPPPVNLAWTMPAWAPVDYPPPPPPRSESFHFETSISQTSFEQVHSPFHQPRHFAPSPENYALAAYGHYTGPQNQTPGIPNYFFDLQPQALDRAVYI
ncbi:hypothetical protein BKA63DRAFT_561528 [Paraphoma chrysanthemicola]|nr:hypothetical protein BKA63DRAFT_561528 [Paraphoma chrysanthemicola]